METQGGTPFISPLQQSVKSNNLKTQIQLHTFAIIVMIVIVGCMGFFILQAAQPFQTTQEISPAQAASSDKLADK